MVTLTRRNLLAAGAVAPLVSSIAGRALAETKTAPALDSPQFWDWVSAQYDVNPDIINVENGNWGLMARPVLDAYIENTRRVNRDNSFFARREYGPIMREIIAETQIRLGAADNEIALTRGASEALQNIIGGYNRLAPGDAVMMADLDYGAMMEAMRWRADQSGCEVVTLAIPEKTDFDGLIEFYREAFDAHPNTKFLLLTHISHRTGLKLPVREITEIAHERGIDIVVDAAHSWGQVEFNVDDLGADFIGFNLHKWIGAPIGVGVMYIRADKLSAIDVNLSEASSSPDRIEARVHSGTSNFAAFLTLPDAFAFQDILSEGRKEMRLKALRKVWVDQVSKADGIEILTPDDDRLHGGITSFRFAGMTSAQANAQIAEYMLNAHNVFTVHRTGIDAGACVRVTPSYYNSLADMQAAANAILDAYRHFTS